jgi:hypothetical protein
LRRPYTACDVVRVACAIPCSRSRGLQAAHPMLGGDAKTVTRGVT